MVAVSDLRLDVAAQTPECPQPLVDRSIVRAARELCECAPLWRSALAPINLMASQQEYALTVPSSVNEPAEIVRPLSHGVQYRGRALPQCDESDLLARHGDLRSETGPEPQRFFMLSPRRLAVSPIPADDLADPIRVTASLRPPYGADSLDDDIGLDWRQTLVDGALGYLLAMPGEAWTNGEAAALHRKSFGAARANAIAQYTRGYTHGTTRARPRPFTRSARAYSW